MELVVRVARLDDALQLMRTHCLPRALDGTLCEDDARLLVSEMERVRQERVQLARRISNLVDERRRVRPRVRPRVPSDGARLRLTCPAVYDRLFCSVQRV